MTNPQMMQDHLPNETLAAFADGRLSREEQRAVVDHLSSCDECRDDLQAICEAKELGVIDDGGKVVTGNFVRRGVMAALAAAAVVVIAFLPPVREWIEFQRTGGVSELVKASETLEQRRIQARLSGGFPHKALKPTYRNAERSNELEDPQLRFAVIHVAAHGNLPGRAIANLLAGERDEAIAALERALREKPNNLVIVSDCAAAYLERARYGGGERYLPRAVAMAGHAYRLKRTPETAWNRALALEMRGSSNAEQAWRDYLALDSTSPWADEVRSRHLRD